MVAGPFLRPNLIQKHFAATVDRASFGEFAAQRRLQRIQSARHESDYRGDRSAEAASISLGLIDPRANTRLFVSVKSFLVVVVCLFAARSVALSFPSEEDVRSKLHAGLTADEVVRMFGEPFDGRVQPCVDCTMTYMSPFNLTVEKEGYTGVHIRFANGRVSTFDILTGNPSYAEPRPPRFFWPYLKFLGVMFVLGVVSKLIIRFTPVARVVAHEVADFFEKREIAVEKAPPEFRFITHETTLQEVIDKQESRRGLFESLSVPNADWVTH